MRFLRRIGSYFGGIFTALSQVLNALLAGSPKQTTSARLGHSILRGNRWARAACMPISFVLFDRRHCERTAAKALERDRERCLRVYGPFAMDAGVRAQIADFEE